MNRQLEELLVREVVLPEEASVAQAEKDAAVTEARRRGALPNPLTRYSGKVSVYCCYYVLQLLLLYTAVFGSIFFFVLLPKTGE